MENTLQNQEEPRWGTLRHGHKEMAIYTDGLQVGLGALACGDVGAGVQLEIVMFVLTTVILSPNMPIFDLRAELSFCHAALALLLISVCVFWIGLPTHASGPAQLFATQVSVRGLQHPRSLGLLARPPAITQPHVVPTSSGAGVRGVAARQPSALGALSPMSARLVSNAYPTPDSAPQSGLMERALGDVLIDLSLLAMAVGMMGLMGARPKDAWGLAGRRSLALYASNADMEVCEMFPISPLRPQGVSTWMHPANGDGSCPPPCGPNTEQ